MLPFHCSSYYFVIEFLLNRVAVFGAIQERTPTTQHKAFVLHPALGRPRNMPYISRNRAYDALRLTYCSDHVRPGTSSLQTD